MGGEVSNISEVANKVSEDIFRWFKWQKIPLMDENFSCHKVDQHKKQRKREASESKNYTHPVDVVFKYFDPYLNKEILLNTDLKCYASNSIKASAIKIALESLAKTIDCARSSKEWQDKYNLDKRPFEVRGMLFVYNHDGKYDKSFLNLVKGLNPEKLSIKCDQVLHIIDPQRIEYLTTVVADITKLSINNELPKESYTFFYPDLYLNKSQGDSENYPATIEMLCSPYMILKHGEFHVLNEKTGEKEICGKTGGYVIYYNQNGSSEYEFIYLFDALSRYQILSSKSSIKIRVAHHEPCVEIKSNYQKAINLYVRSWGCDEFKHNDLLRIEFEIVNLTVPKFMPGHLSWRY